MEACVGAHHLSRKLKALGQDARLMRARYVRPYSKGQKNDFRDAEAIAEAVHMPLPVGAACDCVTGLRFFCCGERASAIAANLVSLTLGNLAPNFYSSDMAHRDRTGWLGW